MINCQNAPAVAAESTGRPSSRSATGTRIDALLDVVADADPSFGKLLARKAELIVERAAEWELAHETADR